MRFLLIGILFTLVLPSSAWCHSASELQQAVEAWLATLSPEQRAAAVLPFEEESRTAWSYLPGKRPGVSFGEMDDAQREKAHAMLATILSEKGHLTAKEVIALEQVLRDMGGGPHRDPGRYFFTIFGEPTSDAPWGWRVEGHHLSINLTVKAGQIGSVTPAFFGANPAEIPIGDRQGYRTLAAEEDLARALLKSLPAELQAKAILDESAPGDILTRRKSQIEPFEPAGVSYAEMPEPQQEELLALIAIYVERFHEEIASANLEAIRKAGLDEIHFAWMGSTEPKQRHYYRIQGPEFLIEYDCVGKDANHIHTVWREFKGDFGRDLLEEHYRSAGPDHEH